MFNSRFYVESAEHNRDGVQMKVKPLKDNSGDKFSIQTEKLNFGYCLVRGGDTLRAYFDKNKEDLEKEETPLGLEVLEKFTGEVVAKFGLEYIIS
jgi:hypothetical protein